MLEIPQGSTGVWWSKRLSGGNHRAGPPCVRRMRLFWFCRLVLGGWPFPRSVGAGEGLWKLPPSPPHPNHPVGLCKGAPSPHNDVLRSPFLCLADTNGVRCTLRPASRRTRWTPSCTRRAPRNVSACESSRSVSWMPLLHVVLHYVVFLFDVFVPSLNQQPRRSSLRVCVCVTPVWVVRVLSIHCDSAWLWLARWPVVQASYWWRRRLWQQSRSHDRLKLACAASLVVFVFAWTRAVERHELVRFYPRVDYRGMQRDTGREKAGFP